MYPTPAQIARIGAWEGALRWLWNVMHAERLAKLEFDCKQPTAFDQIRSLTAFRKALPWLADVPRNVCAQTLVELDRAWQRFFASIAKVPRFKRRVRGERAPMIEPHPKLFRVGGKGRHGSVVFPKLGAIRAVVHALIDGKAKTCAIVREGDEWYAAISYESDVLEPPANNKPAVGIDRGVVLLLADSDGRVVENLRPMEALRAKVANAQRMAARKAKGSKNQRRAKRRAASLQRKASRQRDAVLHRESKHYAENQGVVVVERLNIRGMTASAKGTAEEPGTNVAQKAGLNRAILDSGWGRFVSILRYKSERTGCKVVEVDPAYTSMTCSACEHVAAESRKSQSEFECVACGHRANADVNAAKVILRRGMRGAEGFGGYAVTQPVKKQLRVVRRGTRLNDGASAPAKAPDFSPG